MPCFGGAEPNSRDYGHDEVPPGKRRSVFFAVPPCSSDVLYKNTNLRIYSLIQLEAIEGSYPLNWKNEEIRSNVRFANKLTIICNNLKKSSTIVI